LVCLTARPPPRRAPLPYATPFRPLVGRAPVRVVRHDGHVEAPLTVHARITHERIAPIEPFADIDPRTVVAMALHGVHEIAARERCTAGRDRSQIAVLARPHLDQTIVEPTKRRQMHRTGR